MSSLRWDTSMWKLRNGSWRNQKLFRGKHYLGHQFRLMMLLLFCYLRFQRWYALNQQLESKSTPELRKLKMVVNYYPWIFYLQMSLEILCTRSFHFLRSQKHRTFQHFSIRLYSWQRQRCREDKRRLERTIDSTTRSNKRISIRNNSFQVLERTPFEESSESSRRRTSRKVYRFCQYYRSYTSHTVLSVANNNTHAGTVEVWLQWRQELSPSDYREV